MRLLPFLTVLSTLGLAACVFDASVAKETPHDNDGGGAGDGSVATDKDGGTKAPGTDGGDPGTDGGTFLGTPEPGPSKMGAVFASLLPPTPGNPSGATYAFALFQDGSARAGSCLGRDEGGCHVITCPTGPTPTSATPKQAGTVDVGGISVPWNPLRKEYLYTSQPGLKWSAGQTITLGAAGGDLSAFSGTLIFPESLSITAPGYSPGVSTPLPVSKAAGLPLAWLATVSDVHITLSEYSGGAGQRSIDVTCTVPGPSSSFTIPAAALRDLSTLPTASGGPTRSLQVHTTTSKMLTVDGYTVNLSATVGGAVWEPVVSP